MDRSGFSVQWLAPQGQTTVTANIHPAGFRHRVKTTPPPLFLICLKNNGGWGYACSTGSFCEGPARFSTVQLIQDNFRILSDSDETDEETEPVRKSTKDEHKDDHKDDHKNDLKDKKESSSEKKNEVNAIFFFLSMN